jgi:hypothetical protein
VIQQRVFQINSIMTSASQVSIAVIGMFAYNRIGH